MTSPGCAVLIACWRLPPAGTLIVAARALPGVSAHINATSEQTTAVVRCFIRVMERPEGERQHSGALGSFRAQPISIALGAVRTFRSARHGRPEGLPYDRI